MKSNNTQSPVGAACHRHYEDDIHSMLQCTISFLRKTTDKNAVMWLACLFIDHLLRTVK